MFSVTFILIIILILICLKRIWITRPKNYPPGPKIFPLLGTLPEIAMTAGNSQHAIATNLNKKYGPITGLFLGSWPVILLSDYKSIKESLIRDDTSFRPKIRALTSYQYKKRLGILFIDGYPWKEQRRFLLRHLRDFGYARRSMEPLIHEEMIYLCEKMDNLCTQDQNNGVDVINTFPMAVINILWSLIAGQRYDYKDKKFLRILNSNYIFFRSSDPFSVIGLYPFLQALPFGNSDFSRAVLKIKEVQDYIEDVVEEHLNNYDENFSRDFMDVYIKEMKKEDESLFTKPQLITICTDMFTAGTENLSKTLAYALRYIILDKKIQEKLRNEIFEVVGKEGLPSAEHFSSLHYVNAVINETLRHSGLLPIGLPHAVQEDTDFMGYFIPKDGIIMPNLWALHMDPELWGDPENFRPERFINENGIFEKPPYLLPFGLGHRLCVGETVSRQILNLLLSAIIQRYQFDIPPNGPIPSLDDQLPGIITAPAFYKVSISKVL